MAFFWDKSREKQPVQSQDSPECDSSSAILEPAVSELDGFLNAENEENRVLKCPRQEKIFSVYRKYSFSIVS